MQRCQHCGRDNRDIAEICAACRHPLGGQKPSQSQHREVSPVPPSGQYAIGKPLLIGRDSTNDIVLASPQISRRHAKLVPVNGQMCLSDLDSSNGTFVNGVRISGPTPLQIGDMVELGMTKLVFDGAQLVRFDEEGRARLDVIDLRFEIEQGAATLCLLHDISLQIRPREFVAIVGGSGAGKSTLLKALSGFQPATAGAVYLNGRDLYRHRAAFSSSIGYVPQDDIIHRELTVQEALSYAARLRLPSDVSPQEREARIKAVLDTLGLAHRRETVVAQLSGGERKRVSIGVELLSEPSLLFLDEPTSGLDPGLERHLMEVLRRLADGGTTIVLITHATQNIDLCDALIFLAAGGHLVFYGKPEESLEYFGTHDFAEIYQLVNGTKKTAAQWAQEYREAPYYQAYVEARLEPLRAALGASRASRDGVAAETSPLHMPLRAQLEALASRYRTVIMRDRRNLFILLAQAPLIGLLLALVFQSDLLSAEQAVKSNELDTTRLANPKMAAFLLAIAMAWLGATNAAREIVKERAVYQRERLVSVQIVPYLMSKALLLLGLCALQALLLLLFVSLRIRFSHPGFEGYGSLFLTLTFIGISSAALGLLVSALVSSVDQAGSLVPVILLPQIFLCGALLPLQGGLELISQATIARWGYVGVGQAMGLVPFYDEAVAAEQQRRDAALGQAKAGVAQEQERAKSKARVASINNFKSNVAIVGAGKPLGIWFILTMFTLALLAATCKALQVSERWDLSSRKAWPLLRRWR